MSSLIGKTYCSSPTESVRIIDVLQALLIASLLVGIGIGARPLHSQEARFSRRVQASGGACRELVLGAAPELCKWASGGADLSCGAQEQSGLFGSRTLFISDVEGAPRVWVFRDPSTGRFVEAPVGGPRIPARKAGLASRPLVERRVAVPAGGYRVDVAEHFASSVVATRDASGRIRTWCGEAERRGGESGVSADEEDER